MPTRFNVSRPLGAMFVALTLNATPSAIGAQAAPAAPVTKSDSMRQQAFRLDSEGETKQAREILQRLVDSAPDPAAKADAQRAMAVSYAFDGDCTNMARVQDQVIAYWATREQADPQNAFNRGGEMANEIARVCIDAGDLDMAERYYRRGTELAQREPEPRTHARSLWNYRLAHALGRVAARRGQKAEAHKQIDEARRLLAADTAMAAQQGRYLPYLIGYVALYTNDLATAEAELTKALAIDGNQRDAFMPLLLASVYEKQGHKDKAKAFYQKAYDLASSHNPASSHVRPTARKKLKTM